LSAATCRRVRAPRFVARSSEDGFLRWKVARAHLPPYSVISPVSLTPPDPVAVGRKVPGSVTSVFGEPDDFQAALREDGVLGMLITGRGRFRARLTQITLHRLRLLAAEEHLPRIAFVAVPADAVLVLMPIGSGASPIWGGIAMRAGGVITLGPDQLVHARTDGLAAGAPSGCRPGTSPDMAGR
jgi:hypothetical protein